MCLENTNNIDLWHLVIDTAMDGLIAIDPQGTIRHINVFAAKNLRITPSQAVGKHFRQVFCPSLPINKCWVNLAIKEGENLRNHHFEMELGDGRKCRLVANLTLIKNKSTVLGALIAVRTEDEQDQIREEREKQAAILSSLAEGLFTVDHEWRITSFNRAAERITGWKEHEVLGKYCKHLFGSQRCIENCPLAETLKQSKPILDYETEYQDRYGKKLPVFVNTAILYDSVGEAIGGVVSFRDCTVQKQIGPDTDTRTGFHGIVGKNKRMLEIYQLIQEIADSKSTVLILGESGTGKELVANAIQRLSQRKNKPFIRVNCAAIPDSLIESELFGHVKGAFTDAYTDRIGRFALANGGTIFLDEVGDITPSAQLRLLRVLEEGEFQRLGSSETVKVDVRVIAATNRNLWKMVQDGHFRDDLYYRVNVIPISLPSLRERRDDLPYLVEHFMEKYRRITNKPITDISDKAYDLLMAYDYPGNVRELENIIEHAFARTKGHIITENKLPLYLRESTRSSTHNVDAAKNCKDLEESSKILQALLRNHWNREHAARELGISRTTLWRRMRELDLLNEDSGLKP
jgi:PAS domain S-box-containing protein